MNRISTALALIAFGTGTAFAADAGFRCGGVGQGSQQQMKAEAAQHDALLTFAETSGAYLADVQVQIRDGKGAVVLEAKCDGPLMLVDLPAKGTYQVSATPSDGRKMQSKKLVAGGKPARLVFAWQ